MSHRMSLLEDYNRQMRRRLGRESLTEKLDAIRKGGGFRPNAPSQAHRQTAHAAAPQATEQLPVQTPLFE